jgi:sec-independent protein translocase protein TatC
VAQGEKLNLLPALAVGQYIDFNAKFLLVFGVAFELPLIMTMLARMGAISAKLLVQFRKHAIVVFFLLATIMTPTPDAFNLLLMAVPLILLYEVGIVSVRLWGQPRGVPPKTSPVKRIRRTVT